MNRITDQLWISDIDTVEYLSVPEEVDIVVSTCQDEVRDAVHCSYEHFRMADGTQDDYGGDASYEYFERTVDFVREQLQTGRNTLVHCHLGVSRSPAVCAAAIAAERGLSFDEALEIVEDVRSKVNPNEDLRAHGHRYRSQNG
jgi:protein-tyrosine phosphatase